MEYKNHEGRVISLKRYPEKKMPPVVEEELHFMEEQGISGDFHADGKERQVSLLTLEEKEWMEAQEEKGFCLKKYKENLLIDGISLQKCKTGDLLVCGDVVLEIGASMKSCHAEFCGLAASGRECILAGSSKFAKVRKGGSIRRGMAISVLDCQSLQEDSGK